MKTSEFWLAGILGPLIGLAMSMFALLKITDPDLQKQLIGLGMGLIMAGTGSYAASRGLAKIAGNGSSTTNTTIIDNKPTNDTQAADQLSKL